MSIVEVATFSIQDFLHHEAEKDLLRFSTAGSVDDGKSTLIGRLLYDTQSVYDDQVRSIEGKGTTAPGQIDFALLTDGLRAEREQGITIDVAYRYFSTARRKFTIADTPGHEQYTRNMATGASTADAAVVLLDARKGVLVQSRRHAYIASLLRVRTIIVAVNKMDLVEYDEERFRAIQRDFRMTLDQIADDTGSDVDASFVPVSALVGDNVVHRSDAMRWYDGPSLLEILEAVPASQSSHSEPFRFPVQRVVRPDHLFRGYAGQIASGTIRPGDSVTVLPSGKSAKVERIVTWDGDLEKAAAPLSVTLTLDRELDISRGDLIAQASEPAKVATQISASLVWMDERALDLDRRYLVKHASHTVPVRVSSIDFKTNIETLEREPCESLALNHIGGVSLSLLRPIAFDPYLKNRATGAFILIDSETNGTVAAGMIVAAQSWPHSAGEKQEDNWNPVTAGERQARWGHLGSVLELSGPEAAIDAVERSLFSIGAATCRIDTERDEFLLHPLLVELVADVQARAGLISLVARVRGDGPLIARVDGAELSTEPGELVKAVSEIHRLLQSRGILVSAEKANL